MDVNTLLLAILTVSVVLSLVVTLINLGHPSKGMTLGASTLGVIASGTLLLALWPVLGTPASVLLGYTAIAIGLSLACEALISYQGRRVPRWIIWSPVPVLIVILVWFMHDIQMRTVLNALITVVQTIILISVKISGWNRTPGWGAKVIAIASIFYGAGVAVRGVIVLNGFSDIDTLLTPNWSNSFAYIMSLNGIILFASGLIAMSMEQSWRQLSRSEGELRSYIDNAHDVIYKIDLNGKFAYASSNIKSSLGYDPSQIVGQHFSHIVHPEDMQACNAFFKRLISTKKPEAGLEYRAKHLDNSWRWHDTNAAPLFDSHGELSGMLGIGRDIHERKLNLARLETMAHHDPLTGLLNRAMIAERCDLAIDQAAQNGSMVAVMFLDLDDFKTINDRFGHDVGDAALKAVADILKSTLHCTSSLGRLGGDEYLIILPDINKKDEALAAGRDVLEALSAPILLESVSLNLSGSIGIAVYPDHKVSAKDLIRLADQAMYRSKQSDRQKLSVS